MTPILYYAVGVVSGMVTLMLFAEHYGLWALFAAPVFSSAAVAAVAGALFLGRRGEEPSRR